MGGTLEREPTIGDGVVSFDLPLAVEKRRSRSNSGCSGRQAPWGLRGVWRSAGCKPGYSLDSGPATRWLRCS
jgi:hypothetical protein